MLHVICISNLPYIAGEGIVDAGIPMSNLTVGKRYHAVRDGGWLRV